MKKLFVAIGLLLSMTAMADEGMWLPYLLGQQKYAEMKAKGLKLTPEQLYSINKSSLKDAIIIFGGGCTGEIVSAEGLIFTNHHCGYGAIASASSIEIAFFIKYSFLCRCGDGQVDFNFLHSPTANSSHRLFFGFSA